jgi:hypothetical protein
MDTDKLDAAFSPDLDAQIAAEFFASELPADK